MSNHANSDNTSSTDSSHSYHIPVLLQDTVNMLNIHPDGIYVDCTFGGGGHSRQILKQLGPKGKLFVFDQDEDAMNNMPDDNRMVFIRQNFRHLKKFLRVNQCLSVDAILADLGVSSHQFDEAERGFSIRFDAPLDMRMDNRQTENAAEVLNHYEEKKLHLIFEKYGEVTNARTLARTIVAKRKTAPINTISQFRQAIQETVKGNPNKYLAKVFQALRIEVNDELQALKEMLEQSTELLKPGGRLAIITFHSIEDRIVKHFFKTGSNEPVEEDDVYGTKPSVPLKILTKKPIEPTANEISQNPRSRSARLRVAEKIK